MPFYILLQGALGFLGHILKTTTFSAKTNTRLALCQNPHLDTPLRTLRLLHHLHRIALAPPHIPRRPLRSLLHHLRRIAPLLPHTPPRHLLHIHHNNLTLVRRWHHPFAHSVHRRLILVAVPVVAS